MLDINDRSDLPLATPPDQTGDRLRPTEPDGNRLADEAIGETAHPSDDSDESADEGETERGDHAPSQSAGYAVIATGTLVVLASTLLAPAIPQLTSHFESTQSNASGSGGWASPDLLAKMMITAPAIVVGVLSLAGGWLLDRIGRRVVLLAGIVLFGLAGGIGGVLTSPAALIGSRVVFGFGVAGILLASSTLIGDYYDGRKRQQMLGRQIAAIAVVSTAGMFLAAWLVQTFSWRWPFAIYLLALPMLPWAWKTVEEPEIDDEEDEADSGDGSIPWATISLIYAASFFALAIFHLATTQVPTYLDELGYGSVYMTALVVSIISVCGVPSSLLFQKARDRFSNQTLLVAVFAVGAVGFLIAGVYESIATLCLGLAVFGTLYGFRTPAFNAWLFNAAPAAYRGRLVGGMTACCFFGIFASPLLSNPLRDAIGMPYVILVAAGLQAAFAGAFFYFAIARRKDDEAEATD